MDMRSKIIIDGLKLNGFDLMSMSRFDDEEAISVWIGEQKDFDELVTDGISPDDQYTWSSGGSLDTYRFAAVFENGKVVSYKNGSHWASGCNHEPDTETHADDWHVFLKETHEASFYFYYTYGYGDGDDWNTVNIYFQSERKKRRMAWAIHEAYKKIIAEINTLLDSHAGDDEYISKLVPVSR